MSLEKIKVLTIDDDRLIRSSFHMFLEELGFTVIEAENGQIGFEKIKTEKPDIVLIDLIMPTMDGLTLLKMVKKEFSKLPTIVISGTGKISDAVKALHLGAWDYILKPIEDINILKYTIENVLEKARLTKENEKYQKHLEELVEQQTKDIRKANLRLKEEEEKFRLLSDQSLVGITLISQGRIIYINKAMADILELSMDDLISAEQEYFLKRVVDIDRYIVKSQFITDKEDTNIHKSLWRYRCGDRIKWIESNYKLIEISNYKANFVISIDVTEKIEYEARLQEAKESAEEANRLKSEFLTNISHEFRTPMTTILGYGELLLQLVDDTEIAGYVNSIMSAARGLLALLSDILDFSRISAGKLRINNANTDVSTLLKNIKEIFRIELKKKSLYMKINIEEQFPRYIKIDKVRLRQALVNLVSNGIKFTEQGGIKILMNFKHIDNKIGNLSISVIDTGCGIPKENQKVIFESFRQVSRGDTREHEGAGLGLSITKGLIELMNGKINLESEVDKGSKFVLEFNDVAYKDT